MYRVFVSKTPLFSQGDITELKMAEVISFRREVNGLGAAEIELHLDNYAASNYAENTTVEVTLPYAVGDWIAIEIVNDPAAAKPNAVSTTIVWWGYISAHNQQLGAGFKVHRGTLSCYQFGHYLRDNKIEYVRKSPVDQREYTVLLENGFNPSVDNVFLGNKNPDSIIDSTGSFKLYNFTPGKAATDPVDEKTKYWSVGEAFRYIVEESRCKYELKVDFSKMKTSDCKFLKSIETISSYAGSDIISVVDELMEPLKCDFKINSLSHISVEIIDTTGEYKANNTSIVYTLPDGRPDFRITSEEATYDEVVLRGDRVLVSGSVTTYGTKEKAIACLTPNWSEDDVKYFLRPLNVYGPGKEENPVVDILEFEKRYAGKLNNGDQKDSEDTSANKLSTDKDLDSQLFLKAETDARNRNTRVYQQFNWVYGDKSGINRDDKSKNTILWTSTKCGDQKSDDEKIPFFPRLIFQDEEYTSRDSIATKVHTIPVIQSDDSCTPERSELKFEDFIPVKNYSVAFQEYTGQANKYFKPMLWVRSVGSSFKYEDGKTHLAPVWLNVASPSFNTYSVNVKCDWIGLQLDNPYPEVLSCGYDDIFADPYGSSWTEVKDHTFQRKEWDDNPNFPVGASQFDPYRKQYIGKGHWGRIVASISAYSAQPVEIRWSKDGKAGKHVKYIEDTDFKVWLLRKGLIWKTKNEVKTLAGQTFTPGNGWLNEVEPTTEDEIVRNDLPQMRDYLELLWKYYSKDKRACRWEDRIYKADGTTMNINLKVGDFLKTIKDQTTSLNINSYVSSIEYICQGSSPRIIVSTEYPASPVKTRKRQLSWANPVKKETK